MGNYFKVQFIPRADAQAENPKTNVIEALVKAVSYSDAEKIIIGEESISIEEIKKITKTHIDEVVLSNKEFSYLVKYYITTLDENTGVEKFHRYAVLMTADSLEDAISRFKEFMQGAVSDYILDSVSKTNIAVIYDEISYQH